MATSSILQNVLVKDKTSIKRFVDALERSQTSSAKEVIYSRPVEIIEDPDKIQKLFGVRTDDIF